MAKTGNGNGRNIDDAGEKIGGARKDWRLRNLGVDDLAGMTEAEAVLSVRKDHVWPQPEWPEIIAAGMPREVAAHIKVIRDRISQEPRYRTGSDPQVVRNGFVRMVSRLRDAFMSCRTIDEVRSVYSSVVESLGGASAIRSDRETADTMFSVYANRKCPFAVDYGDAQKVRRLLEDGFPDKVPAWRRGVKVRSDFSGRVVLIKGGRQIGETFATEQEALTWLKENGSKESRRKDGKNTPQRPHLSDLHRDGLPDRRGGRDISPEDFIETFGFRGVEFGLWLPDDERQQVLNLAYDALHDLAEVLSWDPRALSLEGTLAVAFGARGSGKMAAHYEPGRKVVNMTRINGAGSLAHEFAHALDHWCGEVDQAEPSTTVRSGTGWYHRIPDKQKTMLKNLDDKQSDAWVRLTNLLFSTPMTRDAALAHAKSNLDEAIALRDKYIDLRDREMKAQRPNRKFIKGVDAWLTVQERKIVVLNERINAIEKGEVPDDKLGSRESSYATEAGKLCGKSGEYWLRPTEMFARAFESYVFDRIREMNARSDYLVHGVEEDRFAGEDYKGNPYPVGDERRSINASVAKLVDAMKPRAELNLARGPTPI